MPQRGRKRKKTRTHVVDTDERVRGALLSQDELKIPRSLVIRKGKVESELVELVADLRKLMRPHTAVNFKEDSTNRKITLSHYSNSLTSTMGITHILAFSQNSSKINLRIARTPTGPTLSFKVKRFTLSRQLRAVQRRPVDSAKSFESPPVVVTNNFGDATAAPHVKLMRITFQNMFPAINVGTVKLNECRRVVLFHFVRRDVADEANLDDELEDEEVEIRHYAIRAKPVGVDRKVRRLIEAKIPNLSKLNDISEYITGQTSSGAAVNSGALSDSEAEDETAHVVLPSNYSGKGNNKSQTSALKLVELGPRLRLKLVKVERGLASGDVMYHAHVHKSPEEVKELKERKEDEVRTKKLRREEQEANVERKRLEREEKRERREARKKEREELAMARLRGEAVPMSEEDEDGDYTGSESGDDGGFAEQGDNGDEEESDNSEVDD